MTKNVDEILYIFWEYCACLYKSLIMLFSVMSTTYNNLELQVVNLAELVLLYKCCKIIINY